MPSTAQAHSYRRRFKENISKDQRFQNIVQVSDPYSTGVQKESEHDTNRHLRDFAENLYGHARMAPGLVKTLDVSYQYSDRFLYEFQSTHNKTAPTSYRQHSACVMP